MDTKRMIFCLLLAAIISPVFTEEWRADVVKELDALVTSCVVVPCSFTHPKENLSTSRLRGIWHRSTDRDQRIYYEDSTQVLENFRGHTKLLGHLGQNNCSLEMTNIKDHDNGPFCFRIELARTETDTSTVDKFSFVESCVTFRMLPDPPNPTLSHQKTAIQDRPYTITCSVRHTCPSHVPKLTWSRGTADEVIEDHKEMGLGYWEAQSILTIIPEEKDDHSDVTCTAQFNGQKTSSTTLTLYVKRTKNYNHIIIPTVAAFGTAVIFAVFFFFMVKRYKLSRSSCLIELNSRLADTAVIRHIAAKSAQRSMDKDSKMMILCLVLAAIISPVFTEEWRADVVKKLDALVTSCVVVPCSFTHPKENLPTSRLRGIWHRSTDRDQRIYYEDRTQVLENFRGRTKLLGQLGQDNCSLEITNIKDHDNGPFCFRIELARTETDTSTVDKFSFVESCVTFTMLPDPPNPTLSHQKTAIQDRPYTITCSVRHTCPSHVPKLTWSRGTADEVIEDHKEMGLGYWEAQSILTIIPEEKDDHSDVTCTAQFNGQKTSSTTLTLYVKRTENYNHIIIPTVAAFGTAVIFAVFCIFMVKRYKKRIAELQNQEGSVWNRLSRLSRRRI
ncbi:uncharacterized protein LOC116049324 isoform X2 [Sander lucioperca]|uniref:uncharacterized protein LOC116049324 isoform X2 n=1 Tax=Sander lucioperca TaxID=283035 RepID=UPI0016539DCD|nr:uncharacterized protein LOC116049324 isoform X2 [Sander lucioperca]